MDSIWKKIDFRLRICIVVFLSGLLTTPFGIMAYDVNEVLGIYFGIIGAIATVIGIISMLIYWASWADE